MRSLNITKGAAWLLCIASAVGIMSACSDDDPGQPLGNPEVVTDAISYESLSFSWDAIPGAVQYGYRLSNENGVAETAGVTQDTEAYFSGLLPATTYTLEVWAFAAPDGNYTTPPAVTLTATTNALIKLATPTLTATSADGTAVISWNAVPDAEYYAYTITGEDGENYGSGSVYQPTHTITGLPGGNYTYTLTAETSQGGYANSDRASIDFNIEVLEIWRAEGTYSSFALGTQWDATLVAYNNSTYSILAFYGVEGYNFDFTINESNPTDMFQILNGSLGTIPGWSTWDVPTGISWPDHIVAYPWDNYSYMSGDQYAGEIGIGGYTAADLTDTANFSWGYDVFTWGTVVEGPLTIDDLIGVYHSTFDYIENDSYTGWTDQAYTYDCETAVIEFEDETHVCLDGFFFNGAPLVGEFDADAMTITFQPQVIGAPYDNGDYYWLATNDEINGTLTADITNSRSLHMENIGMWYVWADGTVWCCYRGTLDMQFLSDGSEAAPRRLAPRQAGSSKAATKGSAPRPSAQPAKPQLYR